MDFTPTRAKGQSTIGLDHSGKTKGVDIRPGMHGPAVGADAFTGRTVHPGNIARDGAPKQHHAVPVVHGMRSRITPLGGMIMDVHGAPDASSPSYLDIEQKNPKQLTPVRPVPGMKSQQNADCETLADKKNHGDCMLAEAVRTK
jgi:hypothetical protein